MNARLLRLSGSDGHAQAEVDEVLREYLRWCVERISGLGVHVGDPAAMVERHHQGFRAELPNMLGPRGRLLVARLDGEVAGVGALKPVDPVAGVGALKPVDPVAGVGALKPVDPVTVEIKRMYVRPRARGKGVGRALLQRLLADARGIGYRVARLETAVFMTEAQALYQSLGFRDIPMFSGSETSLAGLDAYTRFMEVPLGTVRSRAAAEGVPDGGEEQEQPV